MPPMEGVQYLASWWVYSTRASWWVYTRVSSRVYTRVCTPGYTSLSQVHPVHTLLMTDAADPGNRRAVQRDEALGSVLRIV